MRLEIPLNEIHIRQGLDCMLAEIETVRDSALAVQILQTIYEEEFPAFIGWLCDTVEDLKEISDDDRFKRELEALREATR